MAKELNQNIVNLNQVAEITSQGAHRSVEASEQMVAIIDRLEHLVVQFRS